MTDLTQFLTRGDVARLLGVSTQWVHQLSLRDDFPEPLGRVGNYPVWRARDVERWIKASGRATSTATTTRRSGAKS